MECVPIESNEVEIVATPPLRVPVPITVFPSLNSTEPEGVPVVAETVAVKVTDWPVVDGLALEVSCRAVFCFSTLI